MTRTTKILLLCIITFFCSCDRCKNDDCPNNAIFQFILVDSKGNNLLLTSNDYDADSIRITGCRGDEEIIHFGGVTSGNIIYFEVMRNIDSVLVQYNYSDRDVFIYKNLAFEDYECCESFVGNFDIEMNGISFCTECADTVWEIEK